MTYFETIGVDHQYGATSVRSAKKSLEKSCTICAKTGKHINCDRCAIAGAHSAILSILDNR